MDLHQKFMAVFEGSSTAHGQTTIGNVRKNGKTDAKSFIVKEPLTIDLVRDHLDGTRGIGSIPITSENKCKFGVLDIDTYPIDHADIAKKCKTMKLPFVVCRSKSGGAHLFLFLKEYYPAVDIRDYLGEMAAALGHSSCEIFPKQDQILIDRGDVGNFINLPYFDADNSLRYAVDEKGKEMNLETFLEFVEKKTVTLEDLAKLNLGNNKKEFDDAPWCLRIFFNLGIPEGQRNKVMFHAGKYAIKKFPESWKQMLETWNQKYCSPPLPASEIVTIQQQHEKKDYEYLCRDEPMQSHCDKKACKQAKYGIGGHDTLPEIGGLTILKSEPRLFFLDVDGKRLELSTEQLQMPIQFQRACIEQIDFMPPLFKPGDWQVLVNNLLSTATSIEASEELTLTGQFKELVETYCTSRIRAKSPEEMTMGKPWTEDDLTYFTMKGLQEFLKQRGFTTFNRPQIQQRLKDLNHDSKCHGFKKVKMDDGKWVNLRVWWVPKFETTEVDLYVNKETDDDEIPF